MPRTQPTTKMSAEKYQNLIERITAPTPEPKPEPAVELAFPFESRSRAISAQRANDIRAAARLVCFMHDEVLPTSFEDAIEKCEGITALKISGSTSLIPDSCLNAALFLVSKINDPKIAAAASEYVSAIVHKSASLKEIPPDLFPRGGFSTKSISDRALLTANLIRLAVKRATPTR